MSENGIDDELWEAMADPTRRKLLDLLVAGGQAMATTLTDDLPNSRQAMSKHLPVLERVGLIAGQRQGTRGPLRGPSTAPRRSDSCAVRGGRPLGPSAPRDQAAR